MFCKKAAIEECTWYVKSSIQGGEKEYWNKQRRLLNFAVVKRRLEIMISDSICIRLHSLNRHGMSSVDCCIRTLNALKSRSYTKFDGESGKLIAFAHWIIHPFQGVLVRWFSFSFQRYASLVYGNAACLHAGLSNSIFSTGRTEKR